MRIPSYLNILKRVPSPDEKTPPIFNEGGRLIVVLVEYRIMDEIEYVVNALMRVYNKPKEIGFAIVHGTKNAEYVEKLYSNWENIKLINTGHDNLNRGTYSALLKTPQLWENFTNWSHCLIYQTDACIMRRIDDIYFDYDYIGSPWSVCNQWTAYNAGNGGFSLRNVVAMIRVCEPNRNIPFDKIHRGNEDGFFCSQSSYKYPPINSKLHKAFACEKVKYPTPIGCHQIYYNWSITSGEWNNFVKYMEECLIDGKEFQQNIKTIKEAEEFFGCEMIDEIKCDEVTKENNIKDIKLNGVEITKDKDKLITSVSKPIVQDKKNNIQYTEICDIEKYNYCAGPFTFYLNQKKKNNWNISCKYDYDIMFCKNDDPSTYVKIYPIEKRHEACIHKKQSGLKYMDDNNYVYLVFYPGFDNGGCSGSDIHAPWGNNFNKCNLLPKNGAIILRGPKDPNIVEKLKREENQKEIEKMNKENNLKSVEAQEKMIEQYGLKDESNKGVNFLVYDLFTGVGYYNQLYSLELGVYLANISNRHLIVNMRHPLVACGRPDRNYGSLFDYLGNDFEKYLPQGYSLYKYSESQTVFANEINMSTKMSNIVFVDDELNKPENQNDINEFLHYRQSISFNKLEPIMNSSNKLVSFTSSNASRLFSNFYTNKKNYEIMSKIAKSLNSYNDIIIDVVNRLMTKLPEKFITMHLRFGDWHKNVKDISCTNGNIIDNVSRWLDNNNKDELSLCIMTDRKDNPFFEDMKKKVDVIFLDELIEEEDRKKLGEIYKNTNVAEFLIQKKICEYGEYFIGSQGSTVSGHIQYNNYLNGKEYELHSFMKTTNYDCNTLKFKQNEEKHYTWSKKNYIAGHPLSWSMFFEDNIIK